MGLLTADGAPNQDALTVAARLYAGLFYDALCDFYGDMKNVDAVCHDLMERADTADPRLPFLAICSAYDAVYLALPEPVWWMAGELNLVTQFTVGFIGCLAEFTGESGVMD